MFDFGRRAGLVVFPGVFLDRIVDGDATDFQCGLRFFFVTGAVPDHDVTRLSAGLGSSERRLRNYHVFYISSC